MCIYIKSKKGITLIELILSITILAIIAIPISTLFITISRVNINTKDLLNANQLAQEYIERIKASNDFSLYYGVSGQTDYNITRDGRKYTVRTTITDDYGVYEKDLGNPPPQANFEIDNLVNNGDLQIDEFYNGSYNGTTLLLSEIITGDIIVLAKYSQQLSLNITNESDKTVQIYIMRATKDVTGDVDVNVDIGSVKVYKNVYDQSYLDENESNGYNEWIYKISVEVFSSHQVPIEENKLTEQIGLKRME